MIKVLAAAEDKTLASRLLASSAATEKFDKADWSILFCTAAFATSERRMELTACALDAWEMGRLVVVQVDNAPVPLGLGDLPSIKFSSLGTTSEGSSVAELAGLLERSSQRTEQPIETQVGLRAELPTPEDEAFDLHRPLEAEGRARPVVVMLALVVVAAFVCVIWVAYDQGVRKGQSGLPILTAESVRVDPTGNVPPAIAPTLDKVTEPEAQAQVDTTEPANLRWAFGSGGPMVDGPRPTGTLMEKVASTPRQGQEEPSTIRSGSREPDERVQSLEEEVAALREQVRELKQELGRHDSGQSPMPGPISPKRTVPTGAGISPSFQNNKVNQILRALADKGDAKAQFLMGINYADGIGIEKNDAIALTLVSRAAQQGLVVAQYRLAAMYERGIGVGKDLLLAKKWYERAAEGGNRKAMHNLAVLYADGVGIGQSFAKAAVWFRRAAEHGLGDSQYNFAILLERGMGIEKDLVEAAKWYAIAATGGDNGAQERLDQLKKTVEAAKMSSALRAARSFRPKKLDPVANEMPSLPSVADNFADDPNPSRAKQQVDNDDTSPQAEVTRTDGGRESRASSVDEGWSIAVVFALALIAFCGSVFWWFRNVGKNGPGEAERESVMIPMDTAQCSSIFASYAREDSRRVDSMLSHIAADEVSIWIDRKNLPGGARWPDEIVKAIRRCKTCVVFCSERAFRSDHVLREVHIASKLGKYLIPVALDDSPMPDQFLYFLGTRSFISSSSELLLAVRAAV